MTSHSQAAYYVPYVEEKLKQQKRLNYLKLLFSYIFQAIFFKLLQSDLYAITKKKNFWDLKKIGVKIFFFFNMTFFL